MTSGSTRGQWVTALMHCQTYPAGDSTLPHGLFAVDLLMASGSRHSCTVRHLQLVTVPYSMGCDLVIYTWSVGEGIYALAGHFQLVTVSFTVGCDLVDQHMVSGSGHLCTGRTFPAGDHTLYHGL